MIKQAELQQAYNLGRQAAMEKLANPSSAELAKMVLEDRAASDDASYLGYGAAGGLGGGAYGGIVGGLGGALYGALAPQGGSRVMSALREGLKDAKRGGLIGAGAGAAGGLGAAYMSRSNMESLRNDPEFMQSQIEALTKTLERNPEQAAALLKAMNEGKLYHL